MKKGYLAVLGLALVLVLGLVAAACGGTVATTTTSATPTTIGATPTTTSATPTTTSATPTTGPTTASTVAANATPLKVGIAISLTGMAAAPCVAIKEAFDTEIKYLNANGGIAGRQIAATYVDDQSTVDGSTIVIQSLIDKKMDVIIGPFTPWSSVSTRELTESAGVFNLTFGPGALAELQGARKYTYSFAPIPGVDSNADGFAQAMIADGRKNVLGVADQMSPSVEQMKILESLMPMKGITYTLLPDTLSTTATDFTPIANKIAAKVREMKPDAILIAAMITTYNPLITKLKGLGVTTPIYLCANAGHPLPMLAIEGNDPKAVAGVYTEGVAGTDPSKIPDSYPAKAALNDFLARWKADNPKEPFPSMFLGNAYDLIHLVKLAVENAATQDAKGYAEALEKVDYWGADGHLVFSPTDHIGGHSGNFLWQYTDGQGFKFIRDLDAQVPVLPETAEAVKATK